MSDTLALTVSVEESAGTPAYYCLACPSVFFNADASNAHHDETGHNQTWRAERAFGARRLLDDELDTAARKMVERLSRERRPDGAAGLLAELRARYWTLVRASHDGEKPSGSDRVDQVMGGLRMHHPKQTPEVCARAKNLIEDLVRERDALLAQAEQGREDAARLREAAARWQYVRRFLTVECDLTDHVEYLYWGETEEVQAPINEHTVESLVDIAIAATLSPSPEQERA